MFVVQVLRGLGEKSFQQPQSPKVSKNLDTMSIIVEIVFFKLNQIWDKKDVLTCSKMNFFILEVDFLVFRDIKNNIIVIEKQVLSLITILPPRIDSACDFHQ